MNFFNNSKVFQNITAIGISNIVGSALSALFWIYLAGLLGAENYGELSYYISIASITTSISLIGGPAAITVLVAKKVKIESTIYTFSILGSVTSAIVLYFSFTNIGVSIFVIGAVIYNLASSELLGKKFYTKYSIYFILQKVLFILLSFSLYYLIGPEGVLLGVGISFSPFFIRIYRGFKDTHFDLNLFKSKWKFITNNFFIDLTDVFSHSIDKLIIAPLFGFLLLGNYYLGIQILAVLAIMPEIIKKYIVPEDSSGTNTTKIKIITVLFSCLLALVGIFIVPKILPYFFPKYLESLELIPIISISIIPTTIASMYGSKFLAHEKSTYLVISNIISIITLISGIIVLGGLFGSIGLAYSLVLSDSVRAFFLFISNYKIRTKLI